MMGRNRENLRILLPIPQRKISIFPWGNGEKLDHFLVIIIGLLVKSNFFS